VEVELALTRQKKSEIVDAFRTHNSDTGSPEVQIAILSEKINYLTDHFKVHAKDHHSRRGLLKMVSKRKKLMLYLEKTNEKNYKKLIKKLELKG
jgi:small subunit ribosomal protein S15